MRAFSLCLLMALAACGNGLDVRVTRAMDACVALRNPVFVAGNGTTALETPLPPAVDSMAVSLRYKAAFERFQGIAESATTQAILVCALELGSSDPSDEARAWVRQYLAHPNEPVQAAARTLLARMPAR